MGIQTKQDVICEMTPSKLRDKTIELLIDVKRKDKRTKVVYSNDYGFRQKLIMFVHPKTTKSEIIEKFESRLSR